MPSNFSLGDASPYKLQLVMDGVEAQVRCCGRNSLDAGGRTVISIAGGKMHLRTLRSGANLILMDLATAEQLRPDTGVDKEALDKMKEIKL